MVTEQTTNPEIATEDVELRLSTTLFNQLQAMASAVGVDIDAVIQKSLEEELKTKPFVLENYTKDFTPEEHKAFAYEMRFLRHAAVVGKYYTGSMTRRDLTATDRLVLINRYKAAKRRKAKQQRK